jgi:hypothetical protein
MRWVTRDKAHVDRIACPWLITRFVDKQAEFLFVPEDTVMHVAMATGAIPFDVEGVELGHHGDECSFDAIIKKYGLNEPALLELARIVRGAETDMRDPPPESAGLQACAVGFRAICKDDYENMRMQFPAYDALYAYCRGMVRGK